MVRYKFRLTNLNNDKQIGPDYEVLNDAIITAVVASGVKRYDIGIEIVEDWETS